jgi:predicted ATPase
MKKSTHHDRPFLMDVTLLREKVPSWEEYPFNLPVVKNLETLSLHRNVTFIIGENGIGKSTLLEAVAMGMGFNPEGGSRNFRFSTRASHSELFRYLRLSRSARRMRDGFFFRAESYFNVATEIEHLDAEPAFSPPIITYFGNRSLHSNLTESRSWRSLAIGSAVMASTSLTSRKRRYLLPTSSVFW